MISVNRQFEYGKVFNDARCLSTDEKPTDDIRNGSILTEIDTGKRFAFDADGKRWIELPSDGGGGGGTYVLPTMSPTTKGGAKVGAGLRMDGDALEATHDMGLTSAGVGQVPVVAAVDANGVPTSWDAANAYSLPTMSSDTKGGAKLGDGLEMDGEALHVGSLAKESSGSVYGPLASVTAKGWSEQDSTTGKNLLPLIAQTRNGITWTIVDGVLRFSGTAAATYAYYYPQNADGQSNKLSLNAGTYTISGAINSTSGVGINVQVTLGETVLLPWDSSSGSFTLESASEVLIYYNLVGLTVGTSYSGTAELQLELGSTATAYEPYTGGAPSPSPDYPQEIQVARWRNLLNPNEYKPVGAYSAGGWVTNQNYKSQWFRAEQGETYVLQRSDTSAGAMSIRFYATEPDPSVGQSTSYAPLLHIITGEQSVPANSLSIIATAPSGTKWVFVTVNSTGMAVDALPNFQLTLSSMTLPYVPYGYVGLDVTVNGVTTTTPIPLPSRGWVAGLPDGTADVLRIDSAGKVEWELADAEVVFDGSSDEAWNNITSGEDFVRFCIELSNVRPWTTTNAISNALVSSRFVEITHLQGQAGNTGVSMRPAVNTSMLMVTVSMQLASDVSPFKTWLSTHPVTVLYPLATPVIEERGYVDLPEIPSDATVSIPELEQFGCTFWVDSDGSILMLSKQYHERAVAEIAEATEAATNEVLGSVAPIEGSTASTNYSVGDYLVLGTQFCKVTNAIATGEAIAIGTNVVATTVAAEILAMQE